MTADAQEEGRTLLIGGKTGTDTREVTALLRNMAAGSMTGALKTGEEANPTVGFLPHHYPPHLLGNATPSFP